MSAEPEAPASNGAGGADAQSAAARAEAAAARAERAEHAARTAAGAIPAPAVPGAGPAAGGEPPIYMFQGEDGQPLLAVPQIPQLAAGSGQDPPRADAQRRDWTFWVPVSILGALAVLGLLAGVFFIGRATRPSDRDIAARVSRAVAAVQASGDAGKRRALASLREQMGARSDARAARARTAGYNAGKDAGFTEGQSAGYASGQAAGRSAGFSEGKAAGFSEGSSQGFLQGLDLATPNP